MNTAFVIDQNHFVEHARLYAAILSAVCILLWWSCKPHPVFHRIIQNIFTGGNGGNGDSTKGKTP